MIIKLNIILFLMAVFLAVELWGVYKFYSMPELEVVEKCLDEK